MKKFFLIAIGIAALFATINTMAEQGDFATLGYSTSGGYSYWRVDSSGHFIPGYASTYNIGSSALPVSTLYVGTISGAALSSGGAISGTTGSFSSTLSAAGQTTIGSGVYISTFNTAGMLNVPQTITAGKGIVAATGTFTSTLDVDGNVTFGAAGYVSTFTAASGNADFSGAVTGASLKASSGPMTLYSRSSAQILALDPTVVGEMYFCNDCSPVTICVSTGTAVLQFADVSDVTAACN